MAHQHFGHRHQPSLRVRRSVGSAGARGAMELQLMSPTCILHPGKRAEGHCGIQDQSFPTFPREHAPLLPCSSGLSGASGQHRVLGARLGPFQAPLLIPPRPSRPRPFIPRERRFPPTGAGPGVSGTQGAATAPFVGLCWKLHPEVPLPALPDLEIAKLQREVVGFAPGCKCLSLAGGISQNSEGGGRDSSVVVTADSRCIGRPQSAFLRFQALAEIRCPKSFLCAKHTFSSCASWLLAESRTGKWLSYH